ncbi:MAG: threonine/serine dehydratase [Chloroflexi bacterium]|nr:MAG: threonine/serine dehydratase [Chloroflexota bacterium]
MRTYNTADMDLRPADIWQARARIKPWIRRTPLVYSSALSERTGCHVYLKLECWQVCGCFKVRGAVNMVVSLPPEERRRGVTAASSGNHGIALAYAASLFGDTRAIVYAPENADPTKLRKIRALGGEVRLHGENYLLALDEALRQVEEGDLTLVHSHAHPLVMAGQGTIGLEIMEDQPDVDAIVVPIGGGGLISGIATAVKAISESVNIIGVEPTAAPGAYMSFRDGVPHEQIELKPSIADGLLGGFAPLSWKICRDRVSQVVLVDDGEIANAMRVFQQDEQLMIEAASSVGLAAMLSGKLDALKGRKVAFVITSRNVDANKYNQIVSQHSGG